MKKLIMAAITATVVIIVLAGCLMPVMEDATATSDTFTNDGYFYVDKITSADDRTITISWSSAAPTTMVFNGESVDVSSWPNTGYTVATDGESWLIRMGTSNSVRLQLMGENFSGGGASTKTMDITIGAGTVTAIQVQNDDSSYTKTATYTDLWVYSATPTDYVMKKSNESAYLNEDSTYLAMGVTQVTQWNTIIKVAGTVEDYDATIVYPPDVTTVITNKAIVSTANSEHKDLYELEKLTFTVSDGTSTVNAIYSYFIVPAEVTAERSVHFTDSENAILGIVPVMLIIALLVAIVALVIRNREI